METLLGELSEEEGVQRPKDIENVEEGKWIIQGYADLEDVEEEIKTDMPIDVYDTFSGFVCGILEGYRKKENPLYAGGRTTA